VSGRSALAMRLAVNRIPARDPAIFGRQPPLLRNATSVLPLGGQDSSTASLKSASSGNASALGKLARASPMIAYHFRNYWHKPMIPKEDSKCSRVAIGALATEDENSFFLPSGINTGSVKP
jgi:hypothetical protein